MRMDKLRDGAYRLLWSAQERRLRLVPRLVLGLMLSALLYLLLSWIADRLLLDAAWRLWGAPIWVAARGLGQLLAVVLGVFLAVRLLDRRPLAALGFHLGRGWWLDLAFGLALGALLMTGIFLVEWAAGWVTISGTLMTDANSPPFALAFLGALVLFTCVGFYEELFARGYLLRNLAEGLSFRPLRTRGGVVLAWLLSSIAFGLAHLGNPHASLTSTANLILAGLFLGLGYVLSGELAIPIGLHITWNLFQGNVFGFPVSGLALGPRLIATAQHGPELWTGGPFGPEAGLIGVAAMGLGSLLILAWVRRRYGRVALQVQLAYPPRRERFPISEGGTQSWHPFKSDSASSQASGSPWPTTTQRIRAESPRSKRERRSPSSRGG